MLLFLKGASFARVIVIRNDSGVKQLDGTAGRETMYGE